MEFENCEHCFGNKFFVYLNLSSGDEAYYPCPTCKGRGTPVFEKKILLEIIKITKFSINIHHDLPF